LEFVGIIIKLVVSTKCQTQERQLDRSHSIHIVKEFLYAEYCSRHAACMHFTCWA